MFSIFYRTIFPLAIQSTSILLFIALQTSDHKKWLKHSLKKFQNFLFHRKNMFFYSEYSI